MNYKQSLRIGTKVESEHKDVVAYLKKYLKQHKRLPASQKIFKHIAKTHLKEFPNYYTALQKMENKLKKKRRKH